MIAMFTDTEVIPQASNDLGLQLQFSLDTIAYFYATTPKVKTDVVPMAQSGCVKDGEDEFALDETPSCVLCGQASHVQPATHTREVVTTVCKPAEEISGGNPYWGACIPTLVAVKAISM